MASKSQRARAAEAMKKQQRQERVRQLTIVGAIVAVLVVIVGVGFWFQSQRDTTGNTATDVPQGLADDGYSVLVGDAAAPSTVGLYEDFQCPVCRSFEQEIGSDLQQAVDDGQVQLQYFMVAFLDSASTTDYSSRALNAAAVVLDTAGADTFEAYRELLFEHQPAEGTAGLTDDELIQYAVEAGADEAAVAGPIKDDVFHQWVVNATDQMSKNGVNGTPTVLIDGVQAGSSPQEGIDAIRGVIG